jgi:hypothetical protein
MDGVRQRPADEGDGAPLALRRRARERTFASTAAQLALNARRGLLLLAVLLSLRAKQAYDSRCT